MEILVKNNIANGNGGAGVFVDAGSVIAGNIANSNAGNGIAVTCPGLVDSNVATANGTNLALTGAGCVSVNNVAP